MKEKKEKKKMKRRRRRRMRSDGRDGEERCTPLRSKAQSHCEDCTMECCGEYVQTKPSSSSSSSSAAAPTPPGPADNIAGRGGHQG